jgi:hypothetical protein
MKQENVWIIYEQEKRRIEKVAKNAEEYDRMINALCKRLGI